MSSPANMPAIRSSREIEDYAAALVIARRDRSGWSAEDQSQLESWLAQSPHHRAAYLRLDAAWSTADRVRALRPPSAGSARRGGLRNVSIRVAAGLVALVGLGFGASLLLPGQSVHTYATPVGGREILHLADGSQIELNTDTVLRTAVNRTHRKVWLDKGEAYFRIAHDAAHPFVVQAGDRSVTVLGTKFTVRRDARMLEVSLLDGHVRFNAKDEGARMPIDLVPGDVVTATANTVTLRRKPKLEIDSSLSWRRGVLVFDRTPLADAARELNRYNTEKIVIGDDVTAHTTIGGTFESTNVAGFARVAHAVLGLRVQYRRGETVISQ